MAELDCVEHETGPAPVATLIWLHGLGADAHDFEPAIPGVDLGPTRPLRFVFPNAPRRPVTLNGGAVMRAWYDIEALAAAGAEDLPGLRAAAAAVARLVEREAERGIPADRVVLCGFSQGGATALFTALRYPRRLAGVIGLSCYLPGAGLLGAERSPANAGLPVLLCHGDADPVLPVWTGRAARDALAGAGHPVEWHTWPMGHTVVGEELAVVRAFVAARLDAGSGDGEVGR